ncbi:MAG: hypothetical protein J6A04_04005 [Clostridia bacterium]|nr:hypothetical protein [Clostridia bacterium]MBP3581140.1 hypothetical protein [Clostridia bacterium]MBP3681434.1 hypothetical protein [Clostridia bacterium]
MFKLIKKMFANIDTVLKKICVFSFICGLIACVIFFFLAMADDDDFLIGSCISLGACIGVLPLYAFSDMLTQLKLLNEKNK